MARMLHKGTDKDNDQAPNAAGQAQEDGDFDWMSINREKGKERFVMKNR